MRDPLPNELLIDAWKAIVGAERERCLTHRAYIRGQLEPTRAQQTLLEKKKMCDAKLRDPD